MLEYRIVRQNNNAMPFVQRIFKTFDSCYFDLMETISYLQDKKRRYSYYVENDFFENKYPPSAMVHFRIEVREVGEWFYYSEQRTDYNSYNKNSDEKKVLRIF